MVRTTTSDDTEESLTHVEVGDLTEHELREVIPSCDFVVVGYDSSYSDADVSRKTVDDPRHVGSSFRTGVRGPLVGDDADDDRQIGFGKGPIRTSKSAGRIGTTLFVEYPAPEPDKTRYTVTFRAFAGNYSKAGDVDDPEVVDTVTEYTVDKYSYDDVEAPPEDERRVEDIPVKPGRDERRALVDVPVTLTIADVDTTDRDEVVERARDRHQSTLSSWYHPLTRREDLPDVDGDANVHEREYGSPSYVRENTRYMVEDVTVEAVPVE